MSSILLDQLKLLIGDRLDKLVAQTYDGAANLSGSRSSVQTIIKIHYPYAHFIHSYAHKLYPIVQKPGFQNNNVQIFFNSLSGIPTFFNLPQRMVVLDQVAHCQILQSSATRWNFKSRIVQTVFKLRITIIECCTVLEDSFSESTESGASGIKRMLSDPSFLHWLIFFNKVMPHVDILFAQLQSTATDALKANKNLTVFCKESIAEDM